MDDLGTLLTRQPQEETTLGKSGAAVYLLPDLGAHLKIGPGGDISLARRPVKLASAARKIS